MNQSPNLKSQANALKTLQKLIANCPEEWLIRLFEDHTGIDFNPVFVATDVGDHLDTLEQRAALGSQDAVENLAAIGIRVSSFLEGLAGTNSDKVQKNVNASKFIHREVDPNAAWGDSFRKMCKAEMCLLGASVDDLKKSVTALDKAMITPCRLPAATGMFTRRLRKLLRHREIRQDQNKQGGGVATEEPLPAGTESESSKKAYFLEEAKIIEVDLLLNRLLENRAQHLARETVRRVLATSKSWPMVVPSLAHVSNRTANIEKRIHDLGLGTGLGYNLGKATDKQDGVRNITNSVFVTLDRERTKALQMSQSHRAEYQAYENGGVMPALPCCLKMDSDQLRLQELKQWNSMTHWQRKAALLPEPAIEHLDKWVDAAMSFLTSVVSRASYKELIGKGVARRANHGGYNRDDLWG